MQGETDGGLGFDSPTYIKYQPLLQTLVNGWRRNLVKPPTGAPLPFLVVQLAVFKARYTPCACFLLDVAFDGACFMLAACKRAGKGHCAYAHRAGGGGALEVLW